MIKLLGVQLVKAGDPTRHLPYMYSDIYALRQIYCPAELDLDRLSSASPLLQSDSDNLYAPGPGAWHPGQQTVWTMAKTEKLVYSSGNLRSHKSEVWGIEARESGLCHEQTCG